MGATREVFDEIAESWYRLRHRTRFKKELEELAHGWQKGKLLNIGCAHGPDFVPFKDTFKLYGIDSSKEMIKLARKYSLKFNFKANLVVGEAESLPFADDTFDWAISVATYHHIKGETKRGKAFQELRRILKPGGEAFITLWNRGQPRFWLRPKEIKIPWKLKAKTVYRYYYLFSYRELENSLKRASFEIIRLAPEKAYRFPLKIFSQNICALVRKLG